MPFAPLLAALSAREPPVVDAAMAKEFEGATDTRYWMLQDLQSAARQFLAQIDEAAAEVLERHRAKLVESRHGGTRSYRAGAAGRKTPRRSAEPSPRCAS